MGLQGGIAGSNTQLQYNNGGGFGASSDMIYNEGTNVFTFGSGRTGGQFNVSGGLNVTSGVTAGFGNAANSSFGGWVNIQNNQGGVYPNPVYNSGNAGGSLGWNFVPGAGEFTIMNNYNTTGGGIHFRTRTGGSESVITGAFTPVANLVPNVNGNAHLGQLVWASNTDRTYYSYENVWTGSLATGSTNVPIVTTANAGYFMCNAGNNNDFAFFNVMRYRDNGAITWVTINPNTATPGGPVFSVSNGNSSILLSNNSGGTVFWMVKGTMNSQIG